MEALAEAHDPADLADAAYGLYEAFRPNVPRGKQGWGKTGRLSLARIREMARDP